MATRDDEVKSDVNAAHRTLRDLHRAVREYGDMLRSDYVRTKTTEALRLLTRAGHELGMYSETVVEEINKELADG